MGLKVGIELRFDFTSTNFLKLSNDNKINKFGM